MKTIGFTPTTLEVFRQELLKDGVYESPANRLMPVRRKPGWWTTSSFCWAPFSVFPKCAIWEAMGRLTTDKWAHFCFRSFQKAEKFGMPVHMDGWQNRRNYAGPVVYVSNHSSTLETLMLPAVLLGYSPFNVVVKASLSHLPCLEKAAAHMGLIPIGRTSPREDLMTIFREGCDRIAKGNSVLIFPEGTRRPVFSAKHFSSIGAKLAEKAGVPVMPIAVKTDCLPIRPSGKGLLKDFGTVDTSKDIRLRCGPPMTGAARDMQAASVAWIKTQLESWQLPVE